MQDAVRLVNYTKFSCPMHPSYNGDKPKIRGDTDETMLWKASKHRMDQLKARRIRKLHERKSLPCRRGCGQSFTIGNSEREAHMRNCTVDGIRERHHCDVAGCGFSQADTEVVYRRHVSQCGTTYEYTSPANMCGMWDNFRKS